MYKLAIFLFLRHTGSADPLAWLGPVLPGVRRRCQKARERQEPHGVVWHFSPSSVDLPFAVPRILIPSLRLDLHHNARSNKTTTLRKASRETQPPPTCPSISSPSPRPPQPPRTTAVSPTAKKTPSSGRFFSGIGGAGNAHPAAELPSAAASLDDALRHAAKRDNAPVGYCGRGGAGNIYRRKDSDAASASTASSAASVKSSMSSTANLWKRVSGSFGRD
ncbi:hypothetical protein UVI_02045940 [Ustilaginoidea virens]|uniref:Uncharacterized protein n=1 Tax=Ustilaginoidea virens TaxID=1159556 RepID=A0A1B5L8C9_USTVR|nr:hypothetical protein UVI_02045940 [Ustilaginoidea virens]